MNNFSFTVPTNAQNNGQSPVSSSRAYPPHPETQHQPIFSAPRTALGTARASTPKPRRRFSSVESRTNSIAIPAPEPAQTPTQHPATPRPASSNPSAFRRTTVRRFSTVTAPPRHANNHQLSPPPPAVAINENPSNGSEGSDSNSLDHTQWASGNDANSPSHEIATGVNTMEGLIDCAYRNKSLPDQLEECLDVIKGSVKKQQDVVLREKEKSTSLLIQLDDTKQTVEDLKLLEEEHEATIEHLALSTREGREKANRLAKEIGNLKEEHERGKAEYVADIEAKEKQCEELQKTISSLEHTASEQESELDTVVQEVTYLRRAIVQETNRREQLQGETDRIKQENKNQTLRDKSQWEQKFLHLHEELAKQLLSTKEWQVKVAELKTKVDHYAEMTRLHEIKIQQVVSFLGDIYCSFEECESAKQRYLARLEESCEDYRVISRALPDIKLEEQDLSVLNEFWTSYQGTTAPRNVPLHLEHFLVYLRATISAVPKRDFLHRYYAVQLMQALKALEKAESCRREATMLLSRQIGTARDSLANIGRDVQRLRLGFLQLYQCLQQQLSLLGDICDIGQNRANTTAAIREQVVATSRDLDKLQANIPALKLRFQECMKGIASVLDGKEKSIVKLELERDESLNQMRESESGTFEAGLRNRVVEHENAVLKEKVARVSSDAATNAKLLAEESAKHNILMMELKQVRAKFCEMSSVKLGNEAEGVKRVSLLQTKIKDLEEKNNGEMSTYHVLKAEKEGLFKRVEALTKEVDKLMKGIVFLQTDNAKLSSELSSERAAKVSTRQKHVGKVSFSPVPEPGPSRGLKASPSRRDSVQNYENDADFVCEVEDDCKMDSAVPLTSQPHTPSRKGNRVTSRKGRASEKDPDFTPGRGKKRSPRRNPRKKPDQKNKRKRVIRPREESKEAGTDRDDKVGEDDDLFLEPGELIC